MLGVGGAVAQWADRAARTAAPMRQIVAPITHDETARTALAGALTVARAVRSLDKTLILLAPAHSELARAGEAAGLPVRYEVFADRAYLDDGQLMPRSRPGAVLHDAQQCVDHVLAMLREQAIVAASGHRLPTRIDSICVHGDGPEAVASARLIRQALEQASYRLAALDRMG